MNFSGFTEDDFKVFEIDGLEARMEALIKIIRPKLEELGRYFAPTLSVLSGMEMHYHIAKHARRTKNPPMDTWVAFSNNKRGYKMLPHFEIGLWESHLFIMFAVIYDAPRKEEYGDILLQNIEEITQTIPAHFAWSIDHTTPKTIKHHELTDKQLKAMFERMRTVKKAEILCGVSLEKEEAIRISGDEMLNKIQVTFETLQPLYKRLMGNLT